MCVTVASGNIVGNARQKWKVCHAMAFWSCMPGLKSSSGLYPVLLHYCLCRLSPASLIHYLKYKLCSFVDIVVDLSSHLLLRSPLAHCVGVSIMESKVSPTQPRQPLVASFSHQQHSSKHSTAASHPRHIDLQALHSSFVSTRHKKVRAPRSLKPQWPPNLSESNKELVLALGLEEVYRCMAENHKFHIDVVREVAAGQQSLEHADQVLCSMRKAAECEYTHIMKQEFGIAIKEGCTKQTRAVRKRKRKAMQIREQGLACLARALSDKQRWVPWAETLTP